MNSLTYMYCVRALFLLDPLIHPLSCTTTGIDIDDRNSLGFSSNLVDQETFREIIDEELSVQERSTMTQFLEGCIMECIGHDMHKCAEIKCRCLDYMMVNMQSSQATYDQQESKENETDEHDTFAIFQRKRKRSRFLKGCISWCKKEDKKHCVDKICRCVRKKFTN